MAPSAKARVHELEHLLYREKLGAPQEPHLFCRTDHAAKLVKDCIAIAATDRGFSGKPTEAFIEAFTTVESKPTSTNSRAMRQRPIMWTRVANDTLRAKYKARVPLEHVSAYLAAVLDEEGGTRDMRAGFFQIPIPKWARCRFRFRDEAGQLYELTRLPMGHVCAPELCQLLLSAVAGLPEIVTPEHRHIKGVKVHIWIDNLRATGPKDIVQQYFDNVDRDAQRLGVTWKPEDSTLGQHYTFIGVAFDHQASTVACSTKLQIKASEALRDLHPQELTVADIERLVGRLLHASSILAINVSRYYYLLKVIRRRLSQVNRGLLSRKDLAELPAAAVEDLRMWLAEAAANNPRKVAKHRKLSQYVLFSDSSLDGWGAVLIDLNTGCLRVAGGAWKTKPQNINAAELRAIALAVAAFRDVIPTGSKVLLYVDNTSAGAVAKRGSSKRFSMTVEVMQLQKQLEHSDIALHIEYIPSRYNLADGPSRAASTREPEAETRATGCE
jgi:hypothetical protein